MITVNRTASEVTEYTRGEYGHVGYRELHIGLRRVRRERGQIAKGLRSRAFSFWLVTLAIIAIHVVLSTRPNLDADVVLSLVMLFLMHFPNPREVKLQRETDALNAEIKRRNAEWKLPGRKFQLGQRVYCKPEKQYGVLTSTARLRISDWRSNRQTPSDPNAVPTYNILLADGDALEFPELEYETPFARRFGRASVWCDQHKALLTFVVAVLGLILTAAIKLVDK
jgi:hypothetical protein